jgi:hypothetical protein
MLRVLVFRHFLSGEKLEFCSAASRDGLEALELRP